jgi:hypothetical protein
VTLVLGEPLPSPRDVWRLSGPQLAFGQFLAFGQYAVSALVTAAWLQPAFRSSIANRSPLFAAIVPLGFEGGHGVVTGLEVSAGVPKGGGGRTGGRGWPVRGSRYLGRGPVPSCWPPHAHARALLSAG